LEWTDWLVCCGCDRILRHRANKWVRQAEDEIAMKILAMLSVVSIMGLTLIEGDAKGSKTMSVYDFEMKAIDGKSVKLSSYKGQALMIVNVASK
jgi:hypothetical protein